MLMLQSVVMTDGVERQSNGDQEEVPETCKVLQRDG